MLCHRQLKPSIFLGLFMRWGGFGSALNKTAWTSTRAAPLQSMIENTETSIDNDKYFSFWNSHSSTLLLDTLLGVTAYGRAWALYATQSESCLIWLHGSASWARVVHTECTWQTAVALFLHTCKVSCRVWIVSAHMFFGSPSLTSGVRWPAWSRATAASLSSAPPPPHPANHSPARWSPGRNWKPRTSVPTIPPPSYALTF